MLRSLLDNCRSFNILRECQIVGFYGVIIPSNNILAACFCVRCIEEARIYFEHLTKIFNRLFIVLLLLSKFRPRVQ